MIDNRTTSCYGTYMTTNALLARAANRARHMNARRNYAANGAARNNARRILVNEFGYTHAELIALLVAA